MKKNKQKDFIDDERTICNMNFPGMSGYKSQKEKDNIEQISNLNLQKKEIKAIEKSAAISYYKTAIIAIIALCLSFIIVYFWLS